MESLRYLTGFGNHFSTEALKATLPVGQNSPQRVAHGLYAEQLSGSAFTAPRAENFRSWFYRIRPSVQHSGFERVNQDRLLSGPVTHAETSPNQLRWDPLPYPSKPTDFLDGLVTFALNGDPAQKTGVGVHLYSVSESMSDKYLYNADGEFLILPQDGQLRFVTEFGLIDAGPLEVVCIPRGVKFQVRVIDGKARGYVCENYGTPFRLPTLGPIGANGLANPRDFEVPVAAYEDRKGDFKLYSKFSGHLWVAEIGHSPLDVVAWHGNYVPYKYDLRRFQVINTVSFDHPDPSIFTVLTSPSPVPGTANADFVIFPPRWMVGEHTFRPPYYHRNCMSEYMGLIQGVYDAKQGGFVPGGGSLHNCMAPHGPDTETFEKATVADLKPAKIDKTMAFMFETQYVLHPTPFALSSGLLQKDYLNCWKDLPRHFRS